MLYQKTSSVDIIMQCEEHWLSASVVNQHLAYNTRSYYLATWLWPTLPNMDTAELFSHKARAAMLVCHIRRRRLRSSADRESHHWHVLDMCPSTKFKVWQHSPRLMITSQLAEEYGDDSICKMKCCRLDVSLVPGRKSDDTLPVRNYTGHTSIISWFSW